MKPGGNLVLIGMPASGKSTVGVLAAKVLGLDFADTDVMLQRLKGVRLQEILVREGTGGFLEAEDRLLCFGRMDEMRSMTPSRRRRASVRKLPKVPKPAPVG